MSHTIKKTSLNKKKKGKAIDSSCKNNKSCKRCNENRTHFDTIMRFKADDELTYYLEQSKAGPQ